MLVGPGFEPKTRKPPRRMTHVLNCPSTTWVVADVALSENKEKKVQNQKHNKENLQFAKEVAMHMKDQLNFL